MKTNIGTRVKKKDPLKKYKLAAIPLLLVVLGFVSLGEEKETPSKQTAGSQATTAVSAAADPTPLPAQTATSAAWPDVDLDFVAGPNPFASYLATNANDATQRQLVSNESETDATEAPDPMAQLAQDLLDQPVNYIFQSNRRKLLMLGERILEKGEQVSELVKVHDIRDGKLVLMIQKPDASTSDAADSIH